MTLRYCANLKAIRYESTSLNRIVADKSHRVIVALVVFVQASNECIMYRLIHMQPSTDTNATSDQWSYLHKNMIFLVIILILKHVLFRPSQKYLSLVITCLLCCTNCYPCGVIRSSHRIGTRLCSVCIVVKFYNHTLRLRYGCIPMRYYPPLVLF